MQNYSVVMYETEWDHYSVSYPHLYITVDWAFCYNYRVATSDGCFLDTFYKAGDKKELNSYKVIS